MAEFPDHHASVQSFATSPKSVSDDVAGGDENAAQHAVGRAKAVAPRRLLAGDDNAKVVAPRRLLADVTNALSFAGADA